MNGAAFGLGLTCTVLYFTESSVGKFLGLIQTPLHSCAEPNLIKFDFGATVDSDGVLVLNLIRQTLKN